MLPLFYIQNQKAFFTKRGSMNPASIQILKSVERINDSKLISGIGVRGMRYGAWYMVYGGIWRVEIHG